MYLANNTNVTEDMKNVSKRPECFTEVSECFQTQIVNEKRV